MSHDDTSTKETVNTAVILIKSAIVQCVLNPCTVSWTLEVSVLRDHCQLSTEQTLGKGIMFKYHIKAASLMQP